VDVIVNDTVYDVPFDLSLISLGKFIDYHDQYGRDLDTRLNEILARIYQGDPDEVELNRSIDIDNHIDNEALAWFSFWTDHDLYEVKKHSSIPSLLASYRVLRFIMKESLDEVYDLPISVQWNDDEWIISDFNLGPASDMHFNEIITSKEIMRQIYKLGKGRWEALPYLCAVYFRKKGECFSDEFIHEGSDRIELLKQLPLPYALQVAFFLSICVSIWKTTLVASKKEEAITSLN
jgi:hypothetical protein